MDMETDHYVILGLPTGEEGSKLSEREITKAYRQKALELHPDKTPDDPNAPASFHKLQTSYEILRDEKSRKRFDDLVRAKQQKSKCQSQRDLERRRKRSDLVERERNSLYQDPTAKAKSEEDRIHRQLKEEIRRIREMYKKQKVGGEKSRDTDKEKTLKVFPSAGEPVKSSDGICLNENLSAWSYQDYEDYILLKLQKVAKR